MNRCDFCGKETENPKFCSSECYYSYFKKYKIGIFDPKIKSKTGKKVAGICRKNGTSMFFDKKIQSKAGKIGGLASEKARRENRPYTFGGVHFSNESEKLCCINLVKIYGFIPEEEVNCQVKVGSKRFDWKIEYIKTFFEYHPWDKTRRTPEEYYRARRKVLDENGYKDYRLVVIK